MPERSVSLVAMPWHALGSPSAQLGTLAATLDRDGIACRTHSLYLEFHDFLSRHGASGCDALAIDDYGEIATRWENVGAGEWVFALPPPERASERDEPYFALLREHHASEALIETLRRLRDAVPAFLDHCAREILATDPAVVGFTCVYSQVWPSAALARELKRRAPELKIVLGGASCEGPMGAALLRAFVHVDAVVRGEGERVISDLARAWVDEDPEPRLSGLCLRAGDRIVENPPDPAARVAMDDLPVPHYDEYFERLERSSLADRVLPQIPFESSRGCWWGMKSHCTFCGLNGTEMRFRSKSPARVVEEIETLADRHGVLDFTATDNIIDMAYFDSVLPKLAAKKVDLGIFYETKANLSSAHVRALRDAGVRAIQPGIESLSTPTLALMKKGVTALQNIRLLKWCAQHDVRVIWNLLYGFPREDPAEYARMAELVPALVHLAPPAFSALTVYRFSPYHDEPARHGITIDGPLAYYRALYDVDDRLLGELAQAFVFSHADGRDPESYVGDLRERVRRWNDEGDRNRGALTYRRGPSFLVITDTRTTTTSGLVRYTLDATEAAVYEACDAGATKPMIAAAIGDDAAAELPAARLDALLCDLCEARLLYEERGKYLSLAVPNQARSR